MYATPVIYPVSFVPAHWRWILMLNPLGGIIQGFRSAIFSEPLHWNELLSSTAIVLTALAYSLYSFRRMEKEFADII
jgi:lipopolysaccharide transport system permease protein